MDDTTRTDRTVPTREEVHAALDKWMDSVPGAEGNRAYEEFKLAASAYRAADSRWQQPPPSSLI